MGKKELRQKNLKILFMKIKLGATFS